MQGLMVVGFIVDEILLRNWANVCCFRGFSIVELRFTSIERVFVTMCQL